MAGRRDGDPLGLHPGDFRRRFAARRADRHSGLERPRRDPVHGRRLRQQVQRGPLGRGLRPDRARHRPAGEADARPGPGGQRRRRASFDARRGLDGRRRRRERGGLGFEELGFGRTGRRQLPAASLRVLLREPDPHAHLGADEHRTGAGLAGPETSAGVPRHHAGARGPRPRGGDGPARLLPEEHREDRRACEHLRRGTREGRRTDGLARPLAAARLGDRDRALRPPSESAWSRSR